MGQAIYYCSHCGKMLKESAFERATAVWIASKPVCLECAAAQPPSDARRNETRVPSTRRPPN